MKPKCKNCEKDALRLVMRDRDGFGWVCEKCGVPQRTETQDAETDDDDDWYAGLGIFGTWIA